LRLLQDRLARQNQELAAANVELKHLDEIKSMFVSIAAHELRTPLSPIRGYIEMLLEGDMGTLTDRQRESLEVVQRSVVRLVTITNDLLDVSRIEAGRIELILKPLDLCRLVERVAGEFQPELDERSQKLSLSIARPLPLALCDEGRAGQIVGNLVSNASKYSPPESEIMLRLAPAQAEGFLQVSVIDQGPGILAQDQARLFDPFFRTSSASLSRVKGTGLGLYITRSLVELHGGHIWLDSELGRGSSFHVTFPVAGGLVTEL
jgi:signal transduction histidine kinase